MIWPTKVKSDDGKTFYTDDVAPTQGADARPVVICQIEQHNGSWLDVSIDAYESTEVSRRRIVHLIEKESS